MQISRRFILSVLTSVAWWTGVVISFSLYQLTALRIEQRAQAEFEYQAANAQLAIHARVQSYIDVLRGARALFYVRDEITREQFHSYVSALKLEESFPGIVNLNFARHVPASDKKAFESSVRADTSLDQGGYPAFSIKPPGERAEYHVITYLEPMETNLVSFGIDIASRERVARALADARDTGKLNSSGRLIQIQGPYHHVGMAMRAPLYRRGMPIATVAERRAAYYGSVGAGFDIQKLMLGALDQNTLPDMRLRLYDNGAIGNPSKSETLDQENLLFDSSAMPDAEPAIPPPALAQDAFVKKISMSVGSRIWVAEFSAEKKAMLVGFNAYFPALVLSSSLLASLLLYGIYYSLISARRRAIELANDMTKDLRANEAALKRSQDLLRDLTAYQDRVKEDERKRIAREIHDELGQTLLALRIDVSMLDARTGGSHPRLNGKVRDALNHIDATVKTVRTIINNLRPAVLDLGLTAAIEWQVNEFRRRSGIACELVMSADEFEIDDSRATTLFRILQESLTNVIRHAKASYVDIELYKDGDRLVMKITDNGIGIYADCRRRANSFGLVGVEERINALHGEFVIDSAPGQGTALTIFIPLETGPSPRAGSED